LLHALDHFELSGSPTLAIWRERDARRSEDEQSPHVGAHIVYATAAEGSSFAFGRARRCA
jgi:hypothetical protein